MPPLVSFLFTSLASIPLWLYVASRGSKDVPKHRSILTLFLALHTLYIFYNIFFNAPQNVFRSLDLPINAPTDLLRAKVLEYSQDDSLAPHLEDLISRIASFEGRAMYAR